MMGCLTTGLSEIYDGMFNYWFIRNLSPSLLVKEFSKYVGIWQS